MAVPGLLVAAMRERRRSRDHDRLHAGADYAA
jgi:hypothetical protein